MQSLQAARSSSREHGLAGIASHFHHADSIDSYGGDTKYQTALLTQYRLSPRSWFGLHASVDVIYHYVVGTCTLYLRSMVIADLFNSPCDISIIKFTNPSTHLILHLSLPVSHLVQEPTLFWLLPPLCCLCISSFFLRERVPRAALIVAVLSCQVWTRLPHASVGDEQAGAIFHVRLRGMLHCQSSLLGRLEFDITYVPPVAQRL